MQTVIDALYDPRLFACSFDDLTTWKSWTVLGFTYLAIIADEMAVWRSDESAQPDREILTAVRPGLGTIKDSLFLGISTASRRSGVLFDQWKKHWGQPEGPLIWKSSTLAMNPQHDTTVIDNAKKDDLAATMSAYESEWRKDIEGFISLDILERAAGKGGVRQLRKRLARIREDLKGATPALNVKKELLIEQIVRTEAQISLIEMYLKKAGLLKPDKWRKGIIDLQPALSQSYLAFMNSQRHVIMALGIDEEKAEEILAPYEILGKEK